MAATTRPLSWSNVVDTLTGARIVRAEMALQQTGSVSEHGMAARGTHRKVVALLQQVPGVRSVLDIPCGRGAFTRRLGELRLEVHCADVAYEPDGEVGGHYRRADMNERLPFADGELDAVVCIDGIEHIERPYDFTVECARVLRPGGIVLLSTPNISSLRSRWRWLLTGFHHGRKAPLDEENVTPLHHINMMEFPKMRYMLHRAGFRIDAIATNRVKGVAWLFAPLIPIAWLVSWFVFRKEVRSESQRRIAAEVLRQMFTVPVLFGDALIVRAVRSGAAGAGAGGPAREVRA